MLKIVNLICLIFILSCSNKSKAIDCNSLDKKTLEIIDVFYLGDSHKKITLKELDSLAIELSECSKYDLYLRTELMKGYLVGLDDNENYLAAFEKAFDDWNKHLIQQNYYLPDLPKTEGFTEYLNALRFVFKNMNIKQKNSEVGINLLSSQTTIAKEVLDKNKKYKWVLHNQYLNSLMNQLSFYKKPPNNGILCTTVNSIKNEVRNKEYFTAKQLKHISNKVEEFEHCYR